MIDVERDEDRVVIHRGFLSDPRLSLRAKGLMAYLLTRPAAERESVSLASGVAGVAASDVAACLRELEDAGYFHRSDAGSQVIGTLSETTSLPLLSPSRVGRSRPRTESTGAGIAEAAERVLARLNELRHTSWTWARYTPLSSRHAKNVEHIRGRLHEGYGESDLILVLEYLSAMDGGKDESRRFFDSVTPFNTKNFERNLAMAREWEARGRPTSGELSLQRADGHDPAIYERRVKGGPT